MSDFISDVPDVASLAKKPIVKELLEYWFECPHCGWESNYASTQNTYKGYRTIGKDLAETKKDAREALVDTEGKKKLCKKCGGEISFA